MAGRRFVLAPYGSAGDVYPFLWLGQALQQAGASVVLVTSAVFARAAQRCGVRFVPVGEEEDFHRLARNPDFWHPVKGPWRVLMASREWFEPLSRMVEHLLRPAHAVLIASAPNFPATFAAKKCRRPHLTVHLQPVAVFSALATPLLGRGWGWFRRLPTGFKRWLFGLPTPVDWALRPTLRCLCMDAGVPCPRSLLREWWDSPQGVLCFFPPWFAAPQADWPPRVQQTDFPLFDPFVDDAPQEEKLEAFLQSGSPPCLFTAGSAMGCPGKFFAVAVEATVGLGRRALLVTAYPEQLPADLPAAVLPISYAAFARLFPRTAVVVHHGGIGTTAQAFAAGVPQLLLPWSHDQPDNAERIARLGCGKILPPHRRRAQDIQQALAELLAPNNPYLEAVRQVACRLPPPGTPSSPEPALQAIARFLSQH